MTKFHKKLWIGLFILTLLTPLGVILPGKFSAGEAWGEWGTDTLKKLLGYAPEGLKRLADLWKAPIPGYNFGGDNATMTVQVISYIISGFLGMVVAGLAVYAISRLLVRNGK